MVGVSANRSRICDWRLDDAPWTEANSCLFPDCDAGVCPRLAGFLYDVPRLIYAVATLESRL